MFCPPEKLEKEKEKIEKAVESSKTEVPWQCYAVDRPTIPRGICMDCPPPGGKEDPLGEMSST